MTYSIVAVSGCSGGNKGPVGLYESLGKKYLDHDVKFHAIDTTADDIEVNIDKVIRAASESSHAFEKTYLMGYSMGGAVAALAAEKMLLVLLCNLVRQRNISVSNPAHQIYNCC